MTAYLRRLACAFKAARDAYRRGPESPREAERRILRDRYPWIRPYVTREDLDAEIEKFKHHNFS